MTRQQALQTLKDALKEFDLNNPTEARYVRAVLTLAYADMPDEQREAVAILIKRIDELEDVIRGLLANEPNET